MNTYRNASNSFCSTPVSFSEIHLNGQQQPQQQPQQQTQHYSLLNLSSPAGVGSLTPTPITNPNQSISKR
ncbi:unnamed protein product, partial [Adineta steineri]